MLSPQTCGGGRVWDGSYVHLGHLPEEEARHWQLGSVGGLRSEWERDYGQMFCVFIKCLMSASPSDPSHRPTSSPATSIAHQIGLVLANVILIVIVGNLNTAQLQQWGWRVPFLIGSITGFVVSTRGGAL